MGFRVQSLGSNGSGQLGVGHLDDVSIPTDCQFESARDPIATPIKIAAGGNHTLLVCDDGTVYASGYNKDGRCGIVPQDEPLVLFRRVRFDDYKGQPVTQFKFVAATWDASVFVTYDNDVYTCGTGAKGELGQGQDRMESHVPGRISIPGQHGDIISIAACMSHVVVLFSSGEAFGWGRGRQGQLGKPRLDCALPRKFDAVTFAPVNVICGRDFTTIFSESKPNGPGSIQTFGTDKWEIKSQDTQILGEWRHVCACWGTILILYKGDHIRGWGRNDHGQLGPSKLPRVRSIAAGSEHVLVQTEDSEIMAWGWGEHGNCGLPVLKNGDVRENEPNSIGRGILLGAGCATSWICRPWEE